MLKENQVESKLIHFRVKVISIGIIENYIFGTNFFEKAIDNCRQARKKDKIEMDLDRIEMAISIYPHSIANAIPFYPHSYPTKISSLLPAWLEPS